jgi:2-polyprenyl-6-methoxyphenol hydroxylase-like FAD-dependent oxidoreductase
VQLLKNGATSVHIYERAVGTLQDRGAGLGVDPELVRQFLPPVTTIAKTENNSQTGKTFAYLHVDRRRYGTNSGQSSVERASSFVTSYDSLYSCLRQQIPDEYYHASATMVAIEQVKDNGAITKVRVHFADGSLAEGDVLICADGYQSLARQLLMSPDNPDNKTRLTTAPKLWVPLSPALESNRQQATYTGYLLWRGLLEESELSPAMHNYFFAKSKDDSVETHIIGLPPYHLIVYPVPGKGGNITLGQRRLNWGLYFKADETQLRSEFLLDRTGESRQYSLAPGQCSPQVISFLRQLATTQIQWPFKPNPYLELIETTFELDRLFMQAIYEYLPTQMVVGRVCLLGDAAHVASPITGSGARFAMLDALALAEALTTTKTAKAETPNTTLTNALRSYEQQRLGQARQLVASGHQWGRQFLTQGG